MPIIQCVHVQEYLDQICTNRYFYRTSLTINTAVLDEFMAEFRDTMVPLVNAIQSTAVENIRLDCIEVEGIVFGTLGLTGNGGRSGEPMPSFVSMSYRLQRSTRQVKSGGKRYVGIIEEVVQGNGLFPDPTFQGFIDDLAAGLDDVLVTTSGTWSPVLVKFDPANPGTVLADELIAGASFVRISTQNSRKSEI